MAVEEADTEMDVEASRKKEKKNSKIKETREETNQEKSCPSTLRNQKRRKNFKSYLEKNESEKVQVPSYGDNDQDETLLLLIKDFNLMVEDGDLLKE